MHTVPFSDICLKDGFWSTKQALVYQKTLWAVYDRFCETGRITTMDCRDHGITPDFAWASDVFKWLEGAAYLYTLTKDEKIASTIREIVSDVEKGVSVDGYYSSYYNSPLIDKERFTDRNRHELYNIGHMIEAAIAIFEATADDTLLTIAKNCTDLVYRLFVEENSVAFVTPGHEEIELALVRLYRLTNEERYRELAAFFIDQRGNNSKDKPIREDFIESDQTHLPVREQLTAEGHAVRAVYLYSAMADLAVIDNDAELWNAVEHIFTDIYERKSYITGGVGSMDDGEAFARPYYLPNRSAYAETCAALGTALFCRRLYQHKPDGRYGDLAERILFNGMLSGLSLDGTAFFYTNPLEIDPDQTGIRRLPQRAQQRKQIFSTSCCPPNLVRLIPAIADFIYSYDEDTVYVHQYFANEGNIDGNRISLQTKYPQDGCISVVYEGNRKLALRRPAWCSAIETEQTYREENGYLYFGTSSVEVNFVMEPQFVLAHPDVHENQGKVAVMRGPIVYCIEEQDQPHALSRLFLCTDEPIKVSNEFFGDLPRLSAKGICRSEQEGLYAPLEHTESICRVQLIPYYTFANRGVDAMRVWIPFC